MCFKEVKPTCQRMGQRINEFLGALTLIRLFVGYSLTELLEINQERFLNSL